MSPTTDEDWRERVLRALSEHSLDTERIRVELAGHLKDSQRTAQDMYRFLMDPEKGAVARCSALEARGSALETKVAANTLALNELREVPSRLEALEELQAARQERNEWAVRDFLAPTASAVLAAFLVWLFTR